MNCCFESWVWLRRIIRGKGMPETEMERTSNSHGERVSVGWFILGFCLPPVGLILFLA